MRIVLREKGLAKAENSGGRKEKVIDRNG